MGEPRDNVSFACAIPSIASRNEAGGAILVCDRDMCIVKQQPHPNHGLFYTMAPFCNTTSSGCEAMAEGVPASTLIGGSTW